MNRDETLKTLAVLKAAYPNFYRGMSKPEADGVVELWRTMFADEPYALVSSAVKALLASDEKGFPPHIGAVKARVYQLMHPQEMTAVEAWGLVYRALKRSLYNYEAEFEDLPEQLQRFLGSASQLRDWARMDSDVVQSVVASNFQKSYRERMKSDKEYALLPGDVKAALGELTERLAFPEEPKPKTAYQLRRELEAAP